MHLPSKCQLIFVIIVTTSLLVRTAVLDISKRCFLKKNSEDANIPHCQFEYDIISRQRCVDEEGLFIALNEYGDKDQNVFIRCTAPYPMDVDILLQTDKFLLYDRNERFDVISERLPNSDPRLNSSFIHSIKIPILATKELREFKVGRRITIQRASGNGRGEDNEIVRFMFVGDGDFLFRLGPKKVRVTSETVHIPCLYDYTNGIRTIKLSTDLENGTSYEIGYSHKRFDVMHGFKLDLASTPFVYGPYEYTCEGESPSANPSIGGAYAADRPYGVQYIRGVFVQPHSDTIECYQYPCNVYCEYDEPFVLKIQTERGQEITVEGRLLFQTFENITRYAAMYYISSEDVSVECVSTKHNGTMHTWNAIHADIFKPDPSQSLKIEIDYMHGSVLLRCKSDTGINSFFSLQCNNMIECNSQPYLDCMLNGKAVKEWKRGYIDDLGNCAPPNITSVICNGVEMGETCQELSLALSGNSGGGLVHCASKNQTKFQGTYLVGYDGKLYLEPNLKDVPSHAIVRISMENETPTANNLYSGGNYCFACESNYFLTEHGLLWKVKYRNGTISSASTSKDINIQPTKGVWRSDVHPKRKSFILLEKDISAVVCSAPLIHSNGWVDAEYDVNVNERKRLTITNEKNAYLDAKEEGYVECAAEGDPPPQRVTWSLPMLSLWDKPVPSPSVQEGQTSAKLLFEKFQESLAGDYVCWATNGIENVTRTTTITVKGKSYFGAIIGGSLAVTAILILLLAIVYQKWRLTQMALQKLTDAELDEFLNGMNLDGNEEDKRLDYAALAEPYDHSYEIDEKDLTLYKESHLGSGQFGVVYKAAIKHSSDMDLTAAVKTVKSTCTAEEMKSMLDEIKLMIYLGKHENLVQLVGAITKNCRKGEIYIVMEFCELGSLQKYLEKKRTSYETALDNFAKLENKNKSPYLNDVVNGDMVFAALSRWSYEIASGMDYIASKNMVHGDLAIRNILLKKIGDCEVAKISDFGLSRKMNDYAYYVKTKQEPIPWRWLAIETLRQLKFSSKSDVWAYGVLLWELFTLGDVPYPGFSYNMEFLALLESGYRMTKPKYANREIYELMCRCWQKSTTDRPTFSDIRCFWGTDEAGRYANEAAATSTSLGGDGVQ